LKTSLCNLLGIELPIIQAPMAGGATTPDLVSTVCEQGVLGSFGFAYTQPEAMHRDAEAVRARTRRPFNVNLFVAPNEKPIPVEEQRAALDAVAAYYTELGLPAPQPVKPPYAPDLDSQLSAVEAMRPAVFTFHLGAPPPERLARLRELGIRVGGATTCVAEAKKLEAIGVDFVIAQGAEAGGHRGTYLRDPYDAMTGTMALTRLIVRAVKVPVVAAGGIMDGAGIAAALALGAQAAQLGTAFLTCTESGASRLHKAALLAADDDTTRITESFSGKPARGLVNRFMSEMDTRAAPHLAFPAQNALTGPLRAASVKAGTADFLAMWSGQAAALSRECSAAELIASLRDEMRETLQRLSQAAGRPT
jgi:nitronate monooxygenase